MRYKKEILHYECHGLKQGINKLSDRRSLLTPTLPPEERKREKDLQIKCKKIC